MARYQKQPGVLENVIISIGKGIWFLVSWPFKKIFGKEKEKYNRAKNLAKWLEIEKLLDSGDEIHAEQAVVRADKFFDAQLKHGGAQGNTFADRLRDWENNFSRNNYQGVWNAHKLRNQITHDDEHKPSLNECKNALGKFRRGLENIRAL